jgi:hypothetical protein
VQPGTVLGYVGNTGNAIGTPHHLHYGVYRFLGGAQNPYPLLAADREETKITKTAQKSVKKRPPKRISHSKKQTPAKKVRSR